MIKSELVLRIAEQNPHLSPRTLKKSVNRLRGCGRNDGRVLSLRTAEWLMLIVGGLAGSLMLMLR
jgi:hypothetical protein